jgi:hypothetical protein
MTFIILVAILWLTASVFAGRVIGKWIKHNTG